MQVTCISEVLICNQQRLIQAHSREKETIETLIGHRLAGSTRQPGPEQREAIEPELQP